VADWHGGRRAAELVADRRTATGSRADAADDLGGRVLQSVLTALRLLVDAPHIVDTL
jgi:hypothetical protein